MKKEFEVVSQDTFKYLHVFLVHMASRTPHIHREIELGLVMDGKLTVREGKREWLLEKDEMYLINAMEAHEFVARDPHTLILAIQVSPKLMTPFLPHAALIRYQTDPPLSSDFPPDSDTGAELRKLCISLAGQYHEKAACYELACFSLIAQILLLLGRHIPHAFIEQKDYDAARRRMERMARITDYIDQHCQRKLLLEEIAEKNDLTLTYASHLFRDTLGVTFQDYLKEKRFEHAFSLIETTDRTILEISLESGFSDERYLNAIFRARLGCTPKEYRKTLIQTQREPMQASISTQRILSSQETLQLLNRSPYRLHCLNSNQR